MLLGLTAKGPGDGGGQDQGGEGRGAGWSPMHLGRFHQCCFSAVQWEAPGSDELIRLLICAPPLGVGQLVMVVRGFCLEPFIILCVPIFPTVREARNMIKWGQHLVSMRQVRPLAWSSLPSPELEALPWAQVTSHFGWEGLYPPPALSPSSEMWPLLMPPLACPNKAQIPLFPVGRVQPEMREWILQREVRGSLKSHLGA